MTEWTNAMTTIQAQIVGDNALVPRTDFDRLLEIARRNEEIDVQVGSGDLPTADMMRLAEQGGAFQFWLDAGEGVYSVEDGEPVQ
jgi:hypothetical protein